MNVIPFTHRKTAEIDRSYRLASFFSDHPSALCRRMFLIFVGVSFVFTFRVSWLDGTCDLTHLSIPHLAAGLQLVELAGYLQAISRVKYKFGGLYRAQTVGLARVAGFEKR